MRPSWKLENNKLNRNVFPDSNINTGDIFVQLHRVMHSDRTVFLHEDINHNARWDQFGAVAAPDILSNTLPFSYIWVGFRKNAPLNPASSA